MPTVDTDPGTRRRIARVTGALYLGFVLASVLADVLGRLGMGQASDVYDAITSDAWLFRLGLVIAYISALLFLLAAWGLFVLLRPVSGAGAVLFLLLNAVGVAIQAASMLPLLAALSIGEGASTFEVFSDAQREALSLLAIGVYETGFITAQLFFGAWLLPLGYLVYRSGVLPRLLGILLMLGGIGILVWFLQGMLLPELPAIIYPGVAMSFIAEVGLALWLLIKGVSGNRE